MRRVAKVAIIAVSVLVFLFLGIDAWQASQSSVSIVVNLTDGATIGPVQVSICGRPVSLSPVNRKTYRHDAHWIMRCSWAELDVDLISPSGKVLHHQLCYYDGFGVMDAVAEVAPDKLVLKCHDHF